MHTLYSFDGVASVREVLWHAANRAKLDVIAISDHDEIRGALEARDLCAEYGIEVIPAVEISAKEGHVIGLFIETLIPKGLPLIETLIRIGGQGGIGIAVHPNQPIPNSLPGRAILEAATHPLAGKVLRGIEVYNLNPTHSPFNAFSHKLAASLPLAQTGSSDAHIPGMIGAGITHFEGKSAADLRTAIENRATRAEQVRKILPPLAFLQWFWAYSLKKMGFRKQGW